MPLSRRIRPSELGYWLLMENEEENLRCALRTCPGDEELALSIADEGFFLAIFTCEQRELYARFLVDTGGIAIFRGLLLDRLNGSKLEQAQFEFMDDAPF